MDANITDTSHYAQRALSHAQVLAKDGRGSAPQRFLCPAPLAGDRDIGVVELQLAFERNQSRDIEHHRPRPRSLHGGPQAARSAVVEIVDFHDHSAATAEGKTAIAFRARETRDAASGSARHRP